MYPIYRHAERGLYARDTYDDIEARGFKSSVYVA